MAYAKRLQNVITTCSLCRRRMARWIVWVNGINRFVCNDCLPKAQKPVTTPPRMGTD